MSKVHSDDQTYALIGAAMEVHRELGAGFLESVYHDALAMEFCARGIAYSREVSVPVYYKGTRISQSFRLDFLYFESIIVELKAVSQLTGTDDAQVINYLKATNFNLALLLNFGARNLQYKRLVLSNLRQSAKSADQ
ncbi:MAG: GxxExxY protein [Burkholderiales bacterium]